MVPTVMVRGVSREMIPETVEKATSLQYLFCAITDCTIVSMETRGVGLVGTRLSLARRGSIFLNAVVVLSKYLS